VALEANGRQYSLTVSGPQVHSKVLLPKTSELLSEAGLDLSDLDGLVVGTGPGGFTGLRIGMAAIQGFSLAHELPIYPVSSLLNVAAAHPNFDSVWVVMDARMGEVYAQLFQWEEGKCRPTTPARVVNPTELTLPDVSARLAVVGNGLKVYADVFERMLSANSAHLDESTMPCASRCFQLAQQPIQPWDLTANYIRNQVTH